VLIDRLRDEGWGRVVRLIAPIGALILEGWPALIGALLVQEGRRADWYTRRSPLRVHADATSMHLVAANASGVVRGPDQNSG
jgi:hypothetical protein